LRLDVPALEVTGCPIVSLNGRYVLDAPVVHNIYSCGDNDLYVDNAGGKLCWVITDGTSTLCTHDGPTTHLPPSQGWKCWDKSSRSYAITGSMKVDAARKGIHVHVSCSPLLRILT
jgi:hypothetical protein